MDRHLISGSAGSGPEHVGLSMERFRQSLNGEVILRGEDGFDRARQAWNGAIDKRPAMIVYCADAADVSRAATFARSGGYLVAVRSGGHNVAGLSVCDDGIVIDLARLKRIEIDPVHCIARAGAGLSLGEFDSATQSHGLATTIGVNSDTGIAGLTLGGGFGRQGRKHGLACDNLIAPEIVLADGRMLRASTTENADLLWGLRGGGGNFGIVTAFEYRLHPVGPMLLTGSVLHRYDQARDALRFYHAFASQAPDELSVDAALVTTPSGERFMSLSACYAGPITEGERVLAPLRDYGTPAQCRFEATPYLQIQCAGDANFQRGRRYDWKAQFPRERTDPAIDTRLIA